MKKRLSMLAVTGALAVIGALVAPVALHPAAPHVTAAGAVSSGPQNGTYHDI